jgi:hypothetical protein
LRHRAFDWFKDDLVPRWRRIGWLYKGGVLVVGLSALYYTRKEHGPTASTDAIVSTFEEGGVPNWQNHYSCVRQAPEAA